MSASPHPLLLPNIISNIIQHFDDAAFLRSLRHVCNCWNHEVCTLLRRTTTIEFYSTLSMQNYMKIFQETSEIFGVFPHGTYRFLFRLGHSASPESSSSLPETILKFLKHFGIHVRFLHVPIGPGYFRSEQVDFIVSELPTIAELSFNFHYFNSPVNLNFSEKAMLHLQSLQTLTVEIEGFEMSEESAAEFLQIFLSKAITLRKISFPGDIRRISKIGLLLRDVILNSDVPLERLGEWDFKTRLLEQEALKLLCKGLPMKVLHVDLWNPDEEFNGVSSDLMTGLLLKWNLSLEKLAVEFPWRKEVAFHFRFPTVMRNITFLYLGGFEGILLDLLKNLPSLRRLELSQLELISVLPKPSDGEVYPNVKQLRLDFCTGQTAGSLSRCARIFPDLRSLNVNHTTNEAARMIYQKMTHLTRLRMHGNDLTDAGMCGFSESTLKEKDLLNISPIQGNYCRQYPFIADLKELEYLKLDAYSLTEITVKHGLMHCTSLKLVKMDCTAGSDDPSTTVCRKFKLSEYGKHLVEDDKNAVIEMREDPPLEAEALEFLQKYASARSGFHDLATNP